MAAQAGINNNFYDELGDLWYTAQDHPVALLRAESRLRNSWVLEEIDSVFGGPCRVLDIGCGGGFLSNALAGAGHRVYGIDLSSSSLRAAMRRAEPGRAAYIQADLNRLPFRSGAFDVVCAMDVLEHVPDPEMLVREAARVMAPGGLFFFYTFNRNPLSWLVIIKGVEWFVNHAPDNMHIYRLFIKPAEMGRFLQKNGLVPIEFRGVRPAFGRPMLNLITRGTVDEQFKFQFTRSLLLGYCGLSKKPGL